MVSRLLPSEALANAAGLAHRMRLRRSPNIVAYWKGRHFVIEEFVRQRRITAMPLVTLLLDRFDRPGSIQTVAHSFRQYSPASVAQEIRRLLGLGFLSRATGPRVDVAGAWRGCFAAGYYHFATSNVQYPTDEAGRQRYIRERLQTGPQPSLFKDYVGRPRVPLPDDGRAPADMALRVALSERRTVREFARRAVSFQDLTCMLFGTWGQTGSVDTGLLGNLVLKTSPSAGARHPIECYLLAWNVEKLRPGLYHYSVRGNCLERMRGGDLRRSAVRMAAGQKWIERSAFICVMTAVTDRVFWKYPTSDAYRLFFLDAGHLAQTFVLLAAARGLGAFTTAAMDESTIQATLGLDGLSEFPVYLCGAGARPGHRASRAVSAHRSLH
jgi:SagB-type dehydrogenase family enzyme